MLLMLRSHSVTCMADSGLDPGTSQGRVRQGACELIADISFSAVTALHKLARLQDIPQGQLYDSVFITARTTTRA